MDSLDRAILTHVFNSKTQPTVADLAWAAKVDQITVLEAVEDLWHRHYLEILYSNYQLHFRMTCYGMAMTFLSCVVRDAGKNKFPEQSGKGVSGAVDGHRVGMASASPRLSSECGRVALKGVVTPTGIRHSEPMPNSQSIGLKPLSTRGSENGNVSPADSYKFALSSAQRAESGKGAEPPITPISAPQFATRRTEGERSKGRAIQPGGFSAMRQTSTAELGRDKSVEPMSALSPEVPQSKEAEADSRRASASLTVAHRAVEKVLANHGLCPQGPDCIDDPTKVVRIHKCDFCDFKGCIKCVMDHEREPHWTDSQTQAQRFGGMTLVKGGK